MRKIVQASLLVASLLGFYFIYKSIAGPIEFEKESQQRFLEVIAKLKDIRKIEEAYEATHKKYTAKFSDLEDFVDNGYFYITTQRDTSWVDYDKHYKIDVTKQTVLIDTIQKIPVKDSLFKDNDRYKQLSYVEIEGKKIPITIQTGEVTGGNNVKFSVFEVKIPKEEVLEGLDEDEIQKEIRRVGVNDVKGEFISIGSLKEVYTSGNWPSSYDERLNKRATRK